MSGARACAYAYACMLARSGICMHINIANGVYAYGVRACVRVWVPVRVTCACVRTYTVHAYAYVYGYSIYMHVEIARDVCQYTHAFRCAVAAACVRVRTRQ